MKPTKTKTTIDHDTFTITFQRTLGASREDVFEAWTKPEHIAQWWDPSGTPLVECAIDLRPGGAFKFVNVGHAPPFAGVYTEIERPSLLAFDALGSKGTVRLKTERGTTHMTVTIQCASAEHLKQFIDLGVDEGTDRTLDNLVVHVSGVSHAERQEALG